MNQDLAAKREASVAEYRFTLIQFVSVRRGTQSHVAKEWSHILHEFLGENVLIRLFRRILHPVRLSIERGPMRLENAMAMMVAVKIYSAAEPDQKAEPHENEY
jgi:hypothetical protein